jgi:hypothetical protein
MEMEWAIAMTDSRHTVLQIVPQLPGSQDGIGDYAVRLAEYLRTEHGRESIFVAQPIGSVKPSAHIILHYVNYGYHTRGLPAHLPGLVAEWKKACAGKLLTVFHEIYASSSPWRSAFWLQSWQKSIARQIARISDACIVSSETMRDMLLRLAPAATVSVHPVISTIGEPSFPLAQFVRRDPHRWVVFGGTHLLQRSFRSLRERMAAIPDTFVPLELFLVGGEENKVLRKERNELSGIACHYHPATEAAVASEILSSCCFGWIDYFHRSSVPTDVILKSGSFASYCAHGIIPIFPHDGSSIALQGDRMPGPYFVAANRSSLPAPAERANIASDIHEWYRRHGSVTHLAQAIADAFKEGRSPDRPGGLETAAPC